MHEKVPRPEGPSTLPSGTVAEHAAPMTTTRSGLDRYAEEPRTDPAGPRPVLEATPLPFAIPEAAERGLGHAAADGDSLSRSV